MAQLVGHNTSWQEQSPCGTTIAPPHKNFGVKLLCEALEDRIVPDGRPLPLPFIFAGTASGAPAQVKSYFAETGELAFERTPFDPAFAGGVRVAAGDVNYDTWPDLVVAAGPGGGPHVKVLDSKTGEPISGPLGSFYAYDPAFGGGVNVASGDVNGDGWADVVTAAGSGGGPHVKVFSGKTGGLVGEFYAFAPEFTGGVSVSVADYTGDGKADLLVGAGAGGGPHVKVFDLNAGAVPAEVRSFYAFDANFTGGVSVAGDWLTGDVTGDQTADMVIGAGVGGGSKVRVFSGRSGIQRAEFTAFDPPLSSPVSVATAFVNDDRFADIVVGTGAGTGGRVKVFDGRTRAELAAPVSGYTPFGVDFLGGVNVAASNDPPVYGSPGPDLPIDETFQWLDGFNDPTSTDNNASVRNQVVNVNPSRQRWTYTITNTSVDVPGSDTGLADEGIGQWTMPVNDLTSVDKNSFITPVGWEVLWSYSANNESGSITWRVRYGPPPVVPGSPILPTETLTFGFDTDVPRSAVAGGGFMFGPSLSETTNAGGSLYAPGQTPPIDLDILDSTNAEVPEADEWTSGGYVPLNNDNDNYNFEGDQATSLTHRRDKDEMALVDGENDLVPITVKALDGQTNHRFTVSATPGLRIWWDERKSQQYNPNVDLAILQGQTLWVEGIRTSVQPRDEVVTLSYVQYTPGSSIPTKVVADKVRFTVYQVDGAMNVPGYSKHTYQASVAGGAPRFAAGNMATNVAEGALANGARQANILWGAGADVGVYHVYPTAANNWWVKREVNVVKVEFSAQQEAGINDLKFRNDQAAPYAPIQSRMVFSSWGAGAPAMEANLNITKIEGPVVGVTMRGVRFIEAGMVQNVKTSEHHAEFDIDQNNVRCRVYVLEGQSFRDALEPNSVWMWPQPITDDQGVKWVAVDSPGLDPANPLTNRKLHIQDSPQLNGTDDETLTINGGVYKVNRFALLLKFNLYFAVRTMETVLASDTVYTQRGKTEWYFNGSGTILWQRNQNGQPTGSWQWQQGANARNDAPKKFFEGVTDGTVVPITTGPTAKQAASAANNSTTPSPWSTV